MVRRHIDIEQLKNLVNNFSALNDERQRKVMAFILEQQLPQTRGRERFWRLLNA